MVVQVKNFSIPGYDVGPRWIQIDLDAVIHNVTAVKTLLRPETRLMAVVKADAYGFGAVDIARAVIDAGADMLGVTTLDEGVELRDRGIEAPILVFVPFLPGEAEIAARHCLTGTVDSVNTFKDVYAERGIHGKIHIKLNTGMNRFGMDPGEVADCLRLAGSLPGLEVEGIYTHLATTPESNPSFMEKQFNVFCGVTKSLEEQNFILPIKHICNSAAVLTMPQMHLDMVRVGNLIYGQMPSSAKAKIQLQDPWKAHARILRVREVLPGETVGYGCDFKARQKATVGIIPVGFADGLDIAPQFKPKGIKDLLKMLAKTVLSFFGKRMGTPLAVMAGRPLKIVGRIGMQVAAVDLTGIDRVQSGDTVQVFLRRTTASSRLPRVYLLHGEVQSIRTASASKRFTREYPSGESNSERS
jgi:alanine racemase